MQREISDKNTLADTLNPINDARRSTAIDRTTSNYNDAKEKVQKIRELINMGKWCWPCKIYSRINGSRNSRNAWWHWYKRKSSSSVLQRQGTTCFSNSFEWKLLC